MHAHWGKVEDVTAAKQSNALAQDGAGGQASPQPAAGHALSRLPGQNLKSEATAGQMARKQPGKQTGNTELEVSQEDRGIDKHVVDQLKKRQTDQYSLGQKKQSGSAQKESYQELSFRVKVHRGSLKFSKMLPREYLNLLLKGIQSKKPFRTALICFFFLEVLEEKEVTLFYIKFAHHSW